MIQIPRKVLGQFRNVLRKLGLGSVDALTPVRASADSHGLSLRAIVPGVAVEYRQAGDFGKGEICFRGDVLKACQGSKDDRVTFSKTAEKGLAEWLDRIPQSLEFDLASEKEKFPTPPAKLHQCPPAFADSIRLAMPSCSRQGERYATQCLLLDGANDRIVATDGKQLLILSGHSFPWKDEVLLPALAAFALKDVLQEQVQIGKAANQVSLSSSSWTFHCTMEQGRRYPRVDQILPKEESVTAALTLDPEEARFLLDTLPRLPRPTDDAERITLDLGEEVIVRSCASSEQTTDVVLHKSTWEGKEMRLCLSRDYLAHALELGVNQLSFTGTETAILGRGQDRIYVWLPLSDKLAVAASANCRRIEASPSTGKTRKQAAAASAHANGNGRIQETNGAADHGDAEDDIANGAVHDSDSNGNGHSVASEKNRITKATAHSVLETCQGLRDQARALAVGLNDVIRTIKSQQRQNRLVESTLSSLRQLTDLVP